MTVELERAGATVKPGSGKRPHPHHGSICGMTALPQRDRLHGMSTINNGLLVASIASVLTLQVLVATGCF
jgi:hypothetical protein